MCISCFELFLPSALIFFLPVLWVFTSCKVDMSQDWPLLPCVTSLLLLLFFYQNFWKTNPGRFSPSDQIMSRSSTPFSYIPLASSCVLFGCTSLSLCCVLHYLSAEGIFGPAFGLADLNCESSTIHKGLGCGLENHPRLFHYPNELIRVEIIVLCWRIWLGAVC